MCLRSLGLFVIVLSAVLLGGAAPSALAQGPTLTLATPANLSTANGDFLFSVKYLCGTITTATGTGGSPLAAGTYLTLINVHNYGTSVIRAQITVTKAEGQVGHFELDLGPGQVTRFNCACIVSQQCGVDFSLADPLSEGFVIIQKIPTSPPLGHRVHVVAAYTLAPLASAAVPPAQ